MFTETSDLEMRYDLAMRLDDLKDDLKKVLECSQYWMLDSYDKAGILLELEGDYDED